MIPLLIQGFFDRYLIPVIPLLASSMANLAVKEHKQAGGKSHFFVASMLIGFSFFFSACGTRDYLTWNRARWALLKDLLESKRAKAEDIDGGFEFNGLHLYNPNYQQEPDKSWWWVNKDTFVVAFGTMPGYSILEEFKYRQWMPPHDRSILLLEKNAISNTRPQDVKSVE